MSTNPINIRLKRYLASGHRPMPESGFTLMELLMAILVGGMVTYGMLALVVNLLGTERQETAKSQVQQEMNQALDYIAAEVQQAVFIYTKGNFPDPQRLNLGADVHPVIAFWKATPLEGTDLDNFLAGVGDPPSCDNHPNPGSCRLILTNLQTYNLIIYGVKKNLPNEATQWQQDGARIIRYELKQYSDFTDLTSTDVYGNPPDFPSSPNDFEEWVPTNNIAWNTGGKDSAVLIDGLDYDDQVPEPEDCPHDRNNYQLATLRNTTTDRWNDSFYACTRDFNTEVSQDAILFLRGNSATKAGQKGSKNTAYLPRFERRVQARTVLGRRPSK